MFSSIAILAHKEKIRKKRNNQLAVDSSESVLPSDGTPHTDEKKAAQSVLEVKT